MATPLLHDREQRAYLALACLRLVMGAVFLAVWEYNLTKGRVAPAGAGTPRRPLCRHHQVGPYATFLRHVMLASCLADRAGAAGGRVARRLCLALGLFAPVAGLLGGLFQLNLLVATSGTTDWPGTYIALAAICLVVAASQAAGPWAWTRCSRGDGAAARAGLLGALRRHASLSGNDEVI